MNVSQVGYYNISCLPLPLPVVCPVLRVASWAPGPLCWAGGRGGCFDSAAAGAGARHLCLVILHAETAEIDVI